MEREEVEDGNSQFRFNSCFRGGRRGPPGVIRPPAFLEESREPPLSFL